MGERVRKFWAKIPKEQESLVNVGSFPHSGMMHIERVAMRDISTETNNPSFYRSKTPVDFRERFVVPHACSRGTENRGSAKRNRASPKPSRELSGRLQSADHRQERRCQSFSKRPAPHERRKSCHSERSVRAVRTRREESLQTRECMGPVGIPHPRKARGVRNDNARPKLHWQP
jgi:hypothetical protein